MAEDKARTMEGLIEKLDAIEKVLAERISAIEKVAAERDSRYETMFAAAKEAVAAALTAAKEAVAAALMAQKEAVIKAEEGQRTYNAGHNDLARKMETQYNVMLPRTEAQVEFRRYDEKVEGVKREIAELRESRAQVVDGLKKEIADLRESRSELNGRDEAANTLRTGVRAVIAMVITVAIFLIGLALNGWSKP